jgi:hypothetical protein
MTKYYENAIKPSLLIVIVCIFFIQNSFAQRVEIGPFFGGSYYIGDINPNKHFSRTQLAGGVIARYNINPRWALKANIFAGKVEAYDSDTFNDFQLRRNLHFRSNIYDFSGQIEFNFFEYMTSNPEMPFAPYIFTGFALYRFNPQANLDGEWFDLQPLGTEGQGMTAYPDRKAYSLTQFSFPFGLGFKVRISNSIAFGGEWSLRRTFTDYLDDVSTTYVDPFKMNAERGPIATALANRMTDVSSTEVIEGQQRGNSKRSDWYSFAGVFITFKISGKNDRCSAYTKNKIPRFQYK